MELHQNTVFITGGGSGIGLAFAEALASLDNTVIICGRDQHKLDAVRAQYPQIHTIHCDIADPAELERTVGAIQQAFPQLNVLINNAGVQYRYDFATGENVLSKIEEEIAINLTALMRLTRMMLPVLASQSNAAVMNVSSMLGFIPKKSAPVYCATKAAVHAFSKALRYQLADTTIKVFEIVPPLVDTDMTREHSKLKMSPVAFVQEALRGIHKDRYEIQVGWVKTLIALHRFFPAWMENMIRDK
jgi:short-subunit dehydrogenase involved in D-alanine esterification of teichoic acids